MSKRASTVRFSILTDSQIKELVARWGCTMTQIIALCVDRAYREEVNAMSWIKKHYKIGRYVRAPTRDNDYEAAEIVNHIQGSGFQARHTTGIRVRFEDGSFEDIAAEFLDENGDDLVEGMPGT